MSDDESPLDRLLGLLESEGYSPRRGKGDEWRARCPAHDDRVASLSVRGAEDGRVLLTCHAGCETSAVVDCLGLTMRDLFVRGLGVQPHTAPNRRSRRAKATHPTVGEDKRFGVVPVPLLLHGCPLCVQLFARLAWRCGRENRPQFGLASIAKDLGVQSRTLTAHAEHLACHGWIAWEATVTEAGARRATELSLRHCPALGIVNPDVRQPNRDHGTTGAARSPRPVPSVAFRRTSRAQRARSRDGLSALSAPPVARSTRSTAVECDAANAPDARSLRYEGEVSTREHSADDPARVQLSADSGGGSASECALAGRPSPDDEPPPTDRDLDRWDSKPSETPVPPTEAYIDPDEQIRTLELVLNCFSQRENLDAERCSDCGERLDRCACPGASR